MTTDSAALRQLLTEGSIGENYNVMRTVFFALLDERDRLRGIVNSTARMGMCSQTHHEHLMFKARAALAQSEEARP